jgi:NAD(P)H dehydrogenase (quinone)
MKVGIIIHSHTGNTLSVAERLKEELITAGHSVSLERVTAVNEEPSAQGSVQLKAIPDASVFDVLIFGAPVRGLSLSPVMKAYLSQLPSLERKKVSCFISQYFPYAWMGGTRTINQMKALCQVKNGTVIETGIVNWSHKQRERLINDVLKKLSRL